MDSESAPLNVPMPSAPSYQSDGISVTDTKTDYMPSVRINNKKSVKRYYLLLIGSILIFLFGILQIVVGSIEPNKSNDTITSISPAVSAICFGIFDCILVVCVAWYYFGSVDPETKRHNGDEFCDVFIPIIVNMFMGINVGIGWASYVGAIEAIDTFTPLLIWVNFTNALLSTVVFGSGVCYLLYLMFYHCGMSIVNTFKQE